MKGSIRLLAVALAVVVGAGLAAGRPAMAARPVNEGRPQEAWGAGVDAAWSSGWVAINPGQTLPLTHNLGGDLSDYRVQLWFVDTGADSLGIHTLGYGGLEGDGLHTGAYWQNLTTTGIEVVREADDTRVDGVRVWIWTASLAQEYCTAWAGIGQNNVVDVGHGLGGNVDDYNVLLWFRDSATGNVHQHGYGGLEVLDVTNQRMGAYWMWLGTTTVSVYRYANDTLLDQFRLCVSVVEEAPAYDSGWQDIAAGETLTLTHAVGGNVQSYNVSIEFNDTLALGIHHAGAGGDFLGARSPDADQWGAHWQHLTGESIEVVRQPADLYVDQVRVRIWPRTVRVYLPVVQKGF